MSGPEVKVKITAMPALFLKAGETREIVTEAHAKAMGEGVVAEIRAMTAKGISPVRQVGRFPGYLAVDAARAAKKAISTSRAMTKAQGAKGKTAKAHQKFQANQRQKIDDAHEGYPFNTSQYRAGSKRERPVNLRLTGQQMDALTFRLLDGKFGYAVEIGYFDEASVNKESGHAAGVNGQPKRPTIPNAGEGQEFAVRIMRIIKAQISDAVRTFIKNRK